MAELVDSQRLNNQILAIDHRSRSYQSQPIVTPTMVPAIQPTPISPSSYHVSQLTTDALRESRDVLLRFEHNLNKLRQLSVDDTPLTDHDPISKASNNSNDKTMTPPNSFPLFNLPPEIRIKIYQQIYLTMRLHPLNHNLPDFTLTSNPLHPIRWRNIPNLPIILASQTLAQEFIPAISSLVYFQLPISRDVSPMSTSLSKIRLSLSSTEILCCNASKILLSFFLPKKPVIPYRERRAAHIDRDLLRLWNKQASYWSLVLGNYEALREVEVRVSMRDLPKEGLVAFSPLLRLAGKRGVNVALELMVERDDWRSEAEERKWRKGCEKVVFGEARRVVGDEAAVWVQWVKERDSREV